MQISIPTRFLPENHKIFVLHPGKSKRFYRDFIKQSRVFLDAPGIKLPAQVSAYSKDIIARMRLSNEYARWLKSGAKPDDKPDMDHERFLPKRNRDKPANKAPQYAHDAEGLYNTVKPGDIIIIPGSGYMSDVWFGEVIDAFNTNTFAFSTYYGETHKIPARRIKWIQKAIPKRNFSDRLIQLMHNRRALIQISNAVDKREVYNFLYGDYIESELGVGKIRIDRDKVDFHAFNKSTSLISYFVAMQKAIEQNKEPDFLGLSIPEAIERYYEPDYIFDTSIEIRSPGHISLYSKKLTVPLFVIVLLAATSCGAPIEAFNNVNLLPHPSAEDDPCFVEVSERVQGIMKAMHIERWKELCELRNQATESVGMDQNAEARS